MDNGRDRPGPQESRTVADCAEADQKIFEKAMRKVERDMQRSGRKGKKKQGLSIKSPAAHSPVEESGGYSTNSKHSKKDIRGYRATEQDNSTGVGGVTSNACKRIGSSSGTNSLIDNQLFAEVNGDQEDCFVGGTPFRTVKESVLNYKRDSKNFFVGDLLKNCSRKTRRYDDQWYVWTKDMMESIDKNEIVLNRALLSEGHKKLGSLMEDSCADWSCTIEDKISDLISGLTSIESMIKSSEGMSTIWGRIKHRGVFGNSVRSYLSKVKSEVDKKFDLVDYVKYKGKKWDDHFEKMKDKEDQEDLYS